MLRRVVLSNTARRAGTRFAAAATDPAGARGSEKAASSTGFGFEKGVPAAIGLASALACYTVFCYTKDDSTAVLAHERRTEVPPAALKATKSTARLAAEADGLPNDKATVGARLAVEGCQLANDQPFDSDAPSHRWPITPGGPGITRPKDMQSNRFATKKSDLRDDKKSLEEEQEKSQPRKASKQDKADDRGIVERTKEKVNDAASSVKEKAVELKEKAFDDSEDQADPRKRSDSRKGMGSKDELRRGDLEREGGAFEEEKAGGSLWSKTKRAFGMDTNNSAESEDREEAKDATREAEEKETSKRSARKGEVKPSRQSEDQRRTLNSLGSSADSGRRGDYGSDSARRTADETREMAIQKGRNLRRELEDARDREVTRQDKAQRERTGKSGVDLRKWEEAHRDGDEDEHEPSAYERMSSRLAAAKERVIGKAEEVKEKVADAKDYAADKKDEAKESIRRRADRSSKHSNDDDGESFGEDRGVIDSVKDAALSVKDKAVELKDKALGSNYYVEGDRAERASRDSRRRDYDADKKDEAKESIRSSKRSNGDDGESFGEDRGVIDSVKDVALSVKDKAVELKDKALGSNYYVEGDRAERASRDSRRRDYDADEYSFGEDRGIVERTKEKIKDAASSVKDKAVELKEKAFGTDDEDFEQKKLRTQRDFGRTREAVRESSEELRDRFESSRKGEKQKDAKREPVDETDESVSRLAISDNTKHPDKVLRRDPYTPKEKAYGENRPSVDYSDDKKRPPQSYEAIKAARTGMMADENDTHKDIFQRAKDGIAEATEKIFKKTDKKDSLAEGVWYNDTSKDRAEVFHRQQADPMYGRREKEGDLSELEGAGFHMDKQQDLKRLAERDPAKYLEKKRLEKKYGDDPRIRALNNAKDDDSQFFDDETREREYRREPIDEKDNADQEITKRGSEREQGIYRNDAQRSADTYRESVQGEGHSSAAPTGAGSKSKSHGNAETRRQTNPDESGRTDLTKTDDVRNVGTSYSPYPSAKDLTKADNLSLDGGARGSRDGQAMTDRAKRIQESGAREVGKVQ